MKTRVEILPQSESFASDIVWERIRFDQDELLAALADNSIVGFVQSALTKYKDLRAFPMLVNDVTKSLMAGLARNIKESRTMYKEASVMYCISAVEQVEEFWQKYARFNRGVNFYWIGESCRIEEV